MPTPFFADLVRETCQEGGTGPLTPTGAVPGHRRFADAVPAEALFHYAIAGIAQPAQWETGTGRIDTMGRLVRDSIAASSSGGARVDFSPGLKTLALTVTAEWFAASSVAADAAATAIAGKQPLSTTHEAVTAGAAGDLVTARRSGGWVNIPLSSLAYRGADGRYALDGAITAPLHVRAGGAGDAARFECAGGQSLYLYADGDVLGLFNVAGAAAGRDGIRIGADFVAFDVNAAEALRFDAGGHWLPGYDNSRNIGSASRRMATLYAGTGTINTSDAREKSWRGGASAAEIRAAQRIVAALGFYRWNDAIEEKGTEGARLHFGVRAQAVWAIMADEGLIDPLESGAPPDSRYAFLCHDARDDEGDSESETPGGRFGIRPDQLALFLIAGQDARIAAIEASA